MDYACQICSLVGISYLKKLDTVHHSALQICFNAFQTSPVVSLYVDCDEPPLYLIHEQLSLKLYFRILPLAHYPLRTSLLSREHDILYKNRPSCIPNFDIRYRNMLSCSPLSDLRGRPWLLLNLTP